MVLGVPILKHFRVGAVEGRLIFFVLSVITLFYISLSLGDGEYRKNSKIWDTSNNCHNCPKNRKV